MLAMVPKDNFANLFGIGVAVVMVSSVAVVHS
jgi:hypothetical protein